MKEDKQKIKVMDNDFYREKTAAKKRMVAKNRRYLQHKVIMRLFAVIAVVVTVGCLVQVGRNLWQAHTVKQQTTTAQKKLDKVKKDNASLKLRVKQLNDDEYLEKLIREKYYYSRDNETIYNLPDDKAKSVLNSEK
ncbi:FtsB family cell division protein [Ligilactobacillus murinus]|uniref:Cell division protein DIVIC n=1 Tax=Ligilactobacillus murinus TaxID=1622 RepID=A0AAD0L0L5_9LACO|nr:septum formation initiator family protein [Ligilactobacillus murinus]AWZ38699.1 cell division protein DIVIC [Ligilactobacillus murinus]AWZ40326.1 cell division protein DIVIC [Ligilactobacillus murinus]HCM79590.1 cell division protein DIVIC [Lactobacillus sp.]